MYEDGALIGHDSRTLERQRLVQAMVELGFPAEFGEIVADELGGPWSMARMTGYLLNARPTRPEDVADEMLAILEQRTTIAQKKRTERSNAAWNEFLRSEDDG